MNSDLQTSCKSIKDSSPGPANAYRRWILIACTVSAQIVRAAEVPQPWIQVNRPTVSVRLGFVAHGQGAFYTGGSEGVLLTSTDARTWVQRDIGNTNYLDASAVGGGKIVVHGGEYLAVSADGLAWSQVPQPNTDGVAAMTFGSGVFVALGFAGSIATSTDGANWVLRREADGWENFSEVCHGAPGFVALSGSGVFFSASGESWEKVYTPAAGSPKHCVFADGRFLGVDGDGWLHSSPDGRNWQLTGQRLSFPATKLLHDGSQYLAVTSDSAEIYVSPDGDRWIRQTSPASISVWDALFADGKLVMVGRAGGIVSGPSVGQLETVSAGINDRLVSIAAGPPGAVAVSADRYLAAFSPDGFSWQALPLALPGRATFVRYSRERFLMGGEQGRMWTSPDGREWLAAPLDSTAKLWDLTTDGQTEVLVGQYSLLRYSTNRVDWLPASGGHNENAVTYHTVVWGGGKWLCFGDLQGLGPHTYVLSSDDGREWTRSVLPDTLVKGAAYGNGLFVAVGNYGTVVSSPDGVTWKRQPAPRTDHLTSVTFHQGWFVATVVPERSDTVVPGVLMSTNGVDWVAGPMQVRRGRGLWAGASYDGVLWAAGSDGMIFRAGAVQPPVIGLRQAADTWQLSLATATSADVLIERSDDAFVWQPAGLVIHVSTNVAFPAAPRAGLQFYRAVLR
jgi:WD40 repeat protein